MVCPLFPRPSGPLLTIAGVSEEQITDTFARVGQVNSFRLVYDKETGRPKGFGFLEFADPDAAASAVRNLNDHDIMGRKLRVDWSNDSSSGPSDNNSSNQQYSNGLDAGAQAQQTQSQPGAGVSLPPLPPGTDNPLLSAPDAISQTLSAMPAPQLLDLISQMKGMVAENPAQVTQLFTVAPQLAYAVFQALLLLGLVDTSVLASILQAASAAPAQAPPLPPPQQQQQQYPPPPQPFANPVPPPPISQQQHAYPYPPHMAQQQMHVPTPPVQQHYQPPPPPQQQPVPDQEALIRQVLAMTAEQIHALPPDSRAQLVALRAQLGAPVA